MPMSDDEAAYDDVANEEQFDDDEEDAKEDDDDADMVEAGDEQLDTSIAEQQQTHDDDPTTANAVCLPETDVTQAETEGPNLVSHGTWVHRSGTELVIQNMTVTFDMGQRLDLVTIVKRVRNAEYNPKRFAACIMRLRVPKCTAMVFSSGKMIITGCKTLQNVKEGARRFTRIIQKVGHPKAHARDPYPQNMVVTCDVEFPIRLEALVEAHAVRATYEPELFPGVCYRMDDPKITITIFVNGKITLTGGKSLQSFQQAFDNIYPILEQFSKQSSLKRAAGEAPRCVLEAVEPEGY